jgi:flagellar basal-body rod protein FlgB
MIDDLVSYPTVRLLEQTMNFTEQRQNVLAEDISNISTPGFVARDLSVQDFQKSLRKAIDRKWASNNDTYEPESGESVTFEAGGSRLVAKASELPNSVAFHDRGIRSMEYLMTQMADNAYAHNMAAQFLKSRYDQISRAISMKP